ncbi:hypothetical protein M404DRAFT_296790 [Pisolithus tinctorius Marx 270]|uniref:Uncharacterized protein n=1 Tax=Pisolithus tinctorius Marx 270 TaxID=870435 RepID=A0A0C3IFK3_PISTI|nr:hypothetical protein M404DRAFT_296790 [Pisolithus tinctorius Marx 270]
MLRLLHHLDHRLRYLTLLPRWPWGQHFSAHLAQTDKSTINFPVQNSLAVKVMWCVTVRAAIKEGHSCQAPSLEQLGVEFPVPSRTNRSSSL